MRWASLRPAAMATGVNCHFPVASPTAYMLKLKINNELSTLNQRRRNEIKNNIINEGHRNKKSPGQPMPLLPFFLYSNLKGKSRGHHILSRILKLRFFSRNFLCFVLLRDKDQNGQKMSI